MERVWSWVAVAIVREAGVKRGMKNWDLGKVAVLEEQCRFKNGRREALWIMGIEKEVGI